MDQSQRKIPIIYIVGSGHCGSTLLGLLLDSHPDVVSAGELNTIQDAGVLCSCGLLVCEDSIWREVLPLLPPHGMKITRSKIDALIRPKRIFSLKTSQPIDVMSYRNLHIELYQTIMKIHGKPIVALSIGPESVELLTGDPRIYPIIIHLVRDGRAVAWSYIKKYSRPVFQMWRWFSANLKMVLMKRRVDGKQIFISYEMLAREPEETMRRLADSLGIPYDPGMLRYRNHEHHLVGGNRMRFENTETIREDTQWKKAMPVWQRALFNILFGWFNIYYTKIKKSV